MTPREPAEPNLIPTQAPALPSPIPPLITETDPPKIKLVPVAPDSDFDRISAPGFRTSPSNTVKPVPITPPQADSGTSPKPVEPPHFTASDVEQMAPPAPVLKDALPYGAKLDTDSESQELAAEVAAILSPEQPVLARPPRPLIVKLPSERFLAEATAKIDTLPKNERPAAFQAAIEKYRAMRTAEREKMGRR